MTAWGRAASTCPSRPCPLDRRGRRRRQADSTGRSWRQAPPSVEGDVQRAGSVRRPGPTDANDSLAGDGDLLPSQAPRSTPPLRIMNGSIRRCFCTTSGNCRRRDVAAGRPAAGGQAPGTQMGAGGGGARLDATIREIRNVILIFGLCPAQTDERLSTGRVPESRRCEASGGLRPAGNLSMLTMLDDRLCQMSHGGGSAPKGVSASRQSRC
jgi:hypothetical protein